MERLRGHAAELPRSREEFVASELRQAILTGILTPGEKIDENLLADSLQVSRTPVRSALRLLAAEGLVQLQPHRGAIVTELTSGELDEVYLVRSVLEGLAARLAIPKIRDGAIATLESILQDMETTRDPDEWLLLNSRFHSTIYEAAQRPRMLSIIEYVRNIATPYIRQFIEMSVHMEAGRQGHRRILQACRERDARRGELEIRKHLQSVPMANVERIDSSLGEDAV